MATSGERWKAKYYRLRAAGLCTKCGQAPAAGTYCPACTERANARRRGKSQPRRWLNAELRRTYRREYRRKQRQADRLRVLAHYGGQCACCGEDNSAFLHIDHIDGGGNEERRAVNSKLTRRIVREGFPAKYQVLCANCNHAKAVLGECPHRKEPT